VYGEELNDQNQRCQPGPMVQAILASTILSMILSAILTVVLIKAESSAAPEQVRDKEVRAQIITVREAAD